MKAAPREFIRYYKYENKGSFLDGIRDIRTVKPELIAPRGDCDDFALSLLACLEGGRDRAISALISGKAELWLVRSPVNKLLPRHVMLKYYWPREVDGSANRWIDSTVKKWRSRPDPHTKVSRIPVAMILPLLVWGETGGEVIT